MEMVSNMMPEDIPSDEWLKDLLYKKIRNSSLLLFDIKQYESWQGGDYRKTYRYLLDCIERHISRQREDKNIAAREKYAREFAGAGKPGTPAPATPTPKEPPATPKAKPDPKKKPKAKPKADAGPVLPSPQPKQHAKGKGKRGKSRTRSPSPKDKKKIPCHFHFIKKSCKNGKDCPYSHDQKVFDSSKPGKGKGGGKTPRSSSPANKPKKIDEPCWHWAKGHCRFGDKCIKRHDPHLFKTAPNADAQSSTTNATPALLHGEDSDVEEPIFKVASSKSAKKVKLRPDLTEEFVYEKPDFRKGLKSSQTQSKDHGKIGRTTEDVRKDERWTYNCRLAISRGKAMAIIMDEWREYKDIDEVLIVVGPQLDIRMKFDYDEENEVTKEVFVENYVQHVVGRYGKRGNIMCITVPVEERDKRFIMDSGSGHDLIAAKKIERMELDMYDDETVNFHTANGVTTSTQRSDIHFEALDEPAQVHILEDTPSVLSMGKEMS